MVLVGQLVSLLYRNGNSEPLLKRSDQDHIAMSTSNLPADIFKLATVRAPRKPLVAEDDARRIPYPLDSRSSKS